MDTANSLTTSGDSTKQSSLDGVVKGVEQLGIERPSKVYYLLFYCPKTIALNYNLMFHRNPTMVFLTLSHKFAFL